MKQHIQGLTYTTKRMLPIELIYYEAYKSKVDAQERERQLEQYGAAYGHLKKRIERSIKSVGLAKSGNSISSALSSPGV
jgi:predicted GIY-YIG superfamily endonuclease